MAQFNENLVLLPHSDNVWVDPSIVMAVQKYERGDDSVERHGLSRWDVSIFVNRDNDVARRMTIDIGVNTREQADEVIAAVTPKLTV